MLAAVKILILASSPAIQIRTKRSQQDYIYLYSSITEVFSLCKVNTTNKSIRVTQLTHEPFWLVLWGSKVIRSTSLVLHALKATRTFRIHFCFVYYAAIQHPSFYCLSKVNSFQTGLWNTTNSIHTRAKKEYHPVIHVCWAKDMH